ncbi:MAG: Dna2/Cas4 domain-containing protein [Campylobacter sp.]|nr:Dna2/Cas4 domain-containing protein [Campylobacter sp.]
MKKKLFIFSNSRSIKEFHSKFNDVLLPKTMTIGGFFKECIYHDKFSECSEISRILYMNEAVKKTENLEDKLHISSEFFKFLQNKEYIFSFFKELAEYKKNILDLSQSDIYAQYEEHLEILDSLFKNYTEILSQNRVYDDITLPFYYHIDSNYIENFDEINIEIDGVLTNFHLEILDKISKLTSINLFFKASLLNQNLIQNLERLTALNIPKDHSYKLNLSSNLLENLGRLDDKKEVKVRGFKNDTLQALYIYEKISTFTAKGILPDHIAVIIPDESFSEVLKLYDFKNMLNFAMGMSFKETLFYKLFTQLTKFAKEQRPLELRDDYLNSHEYTKDELFLNHTNISIKIYTKLNSDFNKIVEYSYFKEFINELLEISGNDNIKKLLIDPLYDIEIFMQNFTLKLGEICEIFSMLIRNLTIDHVSGGKVSVIGLLESRGMKFDAIVVPCFNDDLVPNRVINEMFLNSNVREQAGLISYKDRENLQRFYYKNVINSAKFVAICYKESQNSIPSRFLEEFEISKDDEYSDEEYLALLKTGDTELNLEDYSFKQKYNFFEHPLSFSRLNDYLSCPKMYVYKRILKIKEAKKVDDANISLLLGSKIHELIAKSYENSNLFNYSKFCDLLDSKSELNEIYKEIFKVKFKNFSSLIDRGGVVEHEKSFVETPVKFEGIFIEGRIDRVEQTANGTVLTDYKLGSLDSAINSYQLAFYEALMGIKECERQYFSFRFMSFKPPHKEKNLENLKEEIKKLKSISEEESLFDKNESNCKYCPYTLLCKRVVNG